MVARGWILGRISGTKPDVVLFDWLRVCFGQLEDKLSGGNIETLGATVHDGKAAKNPNRNRSGNHAVQ